MIDFYTWSTPNGRKVSIALEEFGLEYETHPINIGADEQFHPDFLKISPNNKIPAIVDRDNGLSLMESGAILVYLAEKTGRFMPAAGGALAGAGVADVADGRRGPDARAGAPLREVQSRQERVRGAALPQRGGSALRGDERAPGGQCRYLAGRGVQHRGHGAWPWVSRYEWQEIDFADFPNVRRWYVEIASRPAVQRGYHVPRKTNEIPIPG